MYMYKKLILCSLLIIIAYLQLYMMEKELLQNFKYVYFSESQDDIHVFHSLIPIHLFLGSKPPEVVDDRREVL